MFGVWDGLGDVENRWDGCLDQVEKDELVGNLTKLNDLQNKHDFNPIIESSDLFWQLFCKIFCKYNTETHPFFAPKIDKDNLYLEFGGTGQYIKSCLENIRELIAKGVTAGKDFEIVIVYDSIHLYVFDGALKSLDARQAHQFSSDNLTYLQPYLVTLLIEVGVKSELTETSKEMLTKYNPKPQSEKAFVLKITPPKEKTDKEKQDAKKVAEYESKSITVFSKSEKQKGEP